MASAANFKNAATAVDLFHRNHPGIAGPPVRLQQWVRAAAANQLFEDHDNVTKKLAIAFRKTNDRLVTHDIKIDDSFNSIC